MGYFWLLFFLADFMMIMSICRKNFLWGLDWNCILWNNIKELTFWKEYWVLTSRNVVHLTHIFLYSPNRFLIFLYMNCIHFLGFWLAPYFYYLCCKWNIALQIITLRYSQAFLTKIVQRAEENKIKRKKLRYFSFLGEWMSHSRLEILVLGLKQISNGSFGWESHSLVFGLAKPKET